MPKSLLFLSFTLLSLSAVAAACSNGNTGGPLCAPPSGCSDPAPATTELTTPTVSFASTVVPLFQSSCSLSQSCHQAKSNSPAGVYLGPAPGAPADPAGVYAVIVSQASLELPSMDYVKPGDLANSYLMHKMDGDQCQFTSQCSQTPVPNCGVVMPQSSCALDGASRDKVRRWIAQGAQNN